MVAFERPPRWGLIAITVLLVANLGLILLLVQRQNSAPTSSPAASMASTPASVPPRTSAPATSTSAEVPATETSSGPGILAVYGDGYSSGNSEGGVGAAGWPAMVAARLGLELQLSAATLAGYVNVGSTEDVPAAGAGAAAGRRLGDGGLR